MARVLNLKTRKDTPSGASTYIPMEPISTSIEHDFVLAMISVIPAAILWIGFDHLFLGIVLGASIFTVAEYGYPAYRGDTLDFSPVVTFAANLRNMIRTRVARGA